MAVVSFVQLVLLLVICCIIVQGEGDSNRQRRQAIGGNNRDAGNSLRNSDGSMLANNGQYNPSNNPSMVYANNLNNQQQSQGQSQGLRSRGYYSSPDFKPPSFSGEKPTGWFDTKYPNWVSDQNTQLQNNAVDGRNGAPSSLQGSRIQARKDEHGPLLLQKVASHYASKGEKSYNFNQFNNHNNFGSVCINHQNFNGYTFGKFRCPLPSGTGMNQLDQYCCGPANYQYCCNAQEFNQNDNEVYGHHQHDYGKHHHSKYSHYSRATRRTLAIVLPIVGILALIGVGVVVFLYYKRLQKAPQNQNKSSGTNRPTDSYAAVPQDPPVERPRASNLEQQSTSAEA